MYNSSRILSVTLLILLISSFFTPAFSSPEDSLKKKPSDSIQLHYLYEKDLNVLNYTKNYCFADTSLNNIQNYKYRFTGNNYNYGFSNSGLCLRSFIFDQKPVAGYNDEIRYFSPFFFKPDNVRYFKVSDAFTDAFYMMGTKREQVFDLLHTQNFARNFNVTVNYKIIFSAGQYLRQKADDAFLAVSSNYSTNNKRYLVIGNYFYNRMKVQENGGIANDSVFDYNFQTSRNLIDVNLLSALNTVKESGMYVKQFYIPGYYKKSSDTLFKKGSYTGFGRFYHSFLFKNQSLVYRDEDPNSGFYPMVLLDTSLTLDSNHIQRIENCIGWSNLKFNSDDKEQLILMDVYAKHQINKVYQQGNDTLFKSIMAGLNLKTKSFAGFSLDGNLTCVVSGYGNGDFVYSSSIQKVITSDSSKNPFLAKVTYVNSKESPRWFDLHYHGNNFSWDYDFSKTTTTNLKFEIRNTNFGISFSYFDMAGLIYYDLYARPKQVQEDVEIAQANVIANFKVGNWHLNNNIFYQKTYGPSVLKLPDFVTSHSLYFERAALKKALFLQVGTDVTFLMGDYVMAYMPATRQFYLQNEFKADPYPFIDIFFNAKIKRARIFVKLEHVNAGFMGHSYYYTEHYPANDRLFRFGISWQFLD
jgi:hypothetical protein